MKSGKKAPCIDMRTDMNKDERVAALADFAGLTNAYEAIGRLFALWSWCADRGLRDAPEDCDGYAVSEAVVRRFFGARGVEGILAEGCDELALGVRRSDGLVYLRGTSERVAAMRRLAATAVAGGKARSNAPRSPAGMFVGAATNRQPISQQDLHPEASSGPPCDQQEPPLFLLPPSSGDLDHPERGSLDQASPFPEPDLRTVVGAERDHAPAATEPPPGLPLELPPGWRPDHELDLEERCRSLDIDIEHELDKLHDRAKRRGEKRTDWQDVWRSWLNRAIEYSLKTRKPARTAPVRSSAEIAARARAEAEADLARIAENDRRAAAERDEVAKQAEIALRSLRGAG